MFLPNIQLFLQEVFSLISIKWGIAEGTLQFFKRSILGLFSDAKNVCKGQSKKNENPKIEVVSMS